MAGIVGIAALLTVLALSFFVTRLATIALTLTGLSEEAARFQARSAFTSTGFTTAESETVVNHPVRRRIVMALMIIRSAGVVTIIISLILSFGDSSPGGDRLARLLWLVAGTGLLLLGTNIPAVNRFVGRLVKSALQRWTDLDTRDYAALLDLSGDYSVRELRVDEDNWLVGKSLSDCQLYREGATVLGIRREDDSYVGVPKGDTELYTGDTLVLYGRGEVLKNLDRRRAGAEGDRAHEEASVEQREHMDRQERQEQSHRQRRRQEADGTREARNR
jgi:NhaP-type Na+/H+ and K+/H+ antiporter